MATKVVKRTSNSWSYSKKTAKQGATPKPRKPKKR